MEAGVWFWTWNVEMPVRYLNVGIWIQSLESVERSMLEI